MKQYIDILTLIALAIAATSIAVLAFSSGAFNGNVHYPTLISAANNTSIALGICLALMLKSWVMGIVHRNSLATEISALESKVEEIRRDYKQLATTLLYEGRLITYSKDRKVKRGRIVCKMSDDNCLVQDEQDPHKFDQVYLSSLKELHLPSIERGQLEVSDMDGAISEADIEPGAVEPFKVMGVRASDLQRKHHEPQRPATPDEST